MVKPKTYYLRVTEKDVLPLEVHSLQKKAAQGCAPRLEERHVQEILQLLYGPVLQYLETRKIKKKSTNTCKTQQKFSDILTGSSVRFGYIMKPRPSSQTCLVVENFAKLEEADNSLQSYLVYKDKIVVYAQPLIPGSPKGMSQLMKVLQEKRQSSQGVSISSYFQKIPSKSAPLSASQRIVDYNIESQGSSSDGTSCQGTSQDYKLGTSQGEIDKQSADRSKGDTFGNQSGLLIAPPSEGRRCKIKSILERGVIGHGKRKSSKSAIDKAKVVQKDQNATLKDEKRPEESNEMVSQMSVEEDNKEILRNSEAEKGDGNDVRISEFEECTITPCDSSFALGAQTDGGQTSYQSCVLGSVHVSRVESPVIKLVDKDSVVGESVTLVSVEQVHEMQTLTENTQAESKAHVVGQLSSSQDEVDNQFPSLQYEFEYQSEKENEDLSNQSESHSDSSGEMTVLPSASFCTRARRRSSILKSNRIIKMKAYEADIDSDSVTNSPKFESKKKENKDNSLDLPGRNIVGSKTGEKTGFPKSGALRTSKFAVRGKRKFPRFSDSDSDDSLPDLKQKTKQEPQKFVNLDSMKTDSKKIKISNSFFTGDGGKAQPTLSFFMNKSSTGSQASQVSEEIQADTVNDEPFSDIDCELIKELSDIPRIKKEADLQLRDEIREMRSVASLNEEHIHYLIRDNEKYLRQIFEGRVKCSRHQDYKKGGNSRRDLNFKSRLSQYTEEQVDTVMEDLIAIFCKRHHKYLDYIMKVLLPEMLIKLHMDVHRTDHDESEKMLAPKQFQPVPSP